jgi:hypothetical protein
MRTHLVLRLEPEMQTQIFGMWPTLCCGNWLYHGEFSNLLP